jgi:hypothetical protein
LAEASLKRFVFILCLPLLAFGGPVLAQSTGDGLKGVYYTNTNLTSAAMTEIDPIVSYRWYGCPPQPGMSGTSFSVQWTGQLEPVYSEAYTIYADVSGAVSLIVNGTVLASHWIDTGPGITRYQGTITLAAGTQVPIEVDYFTNGAAPVSDLVQLGWESNSQAAGFIPHQYLFSGAALSPTPTPQTPSSCQSYTSGITVNGVLNEWPWSTGGWNNVNRTVLGNTYNTSASFKTLWDSSNLYLGVTVMDSQLTSGATYIYDNSTVELYLDTADSRNVTITAGDYEFFFSVGSPAASESLGRTSGVSMSSVTIPGGYVVEASIPWSTLGLGSPGAGQVLGFDLGVDVNHNGGQCRDGQLLWNGGSDDYINPSGYAQLSLAGPCPTPVSTPPAPVGNNPYVSPNPTNGGTVKFVYTMAEAGTAKIKVWNAWGNLVATLSDPKGAGLQSSLLNVSSLAPGHYFYRVELDYDSGRKDSFKTQVLAVKK